MTIENLIKTIPPPAEPAYPYDGPWEHIQAQIGAQLPYDYKELLRLYGAGRFMRFFDIVGPTSPTAEGRLVNFMSAAHSSFIYDRQGSWFYDDPPLPIWPRPGGLLACGQTGWGDYIFWLTRGHVPEWPIVVWDRTREQLESFEYDLTDFLAEIAKGNIHSESFPGTWDPHPGGQAFMSAAAPWPGILSST